jgi:hypothetical protein
MEARNIASPSQNPEWGDGYIEEHVPRPILDQMRACDHWIDDDGFWWGSGYVCASKIRATGPNVVIVASKDSVVNVVMPDNTTLREFGPGMVW